MHNMVIVYIGMNVFYHITFILLFDHIRCNCEAIPLVVMVNYFS